MKKPAGVCLALLSMVVGFASKPALAKRSLYPACGTIARDGRFAAALPDSHGLDLQISGIDEASEKTHLDLEADPEQCRLVFDRKGEYLAVGVRVGNRFETWLHIGVFDCHSKRWLSSFKVGPVADMPFPMRFEGFLENSDTLVVTGFAQGTYQQPRKSAASVALFSPEGHLLRPVITREIPGGYFNWDSDFADATHNRLWFNHDPHFCPLSSTSLTGPPTDGPEVSASVLGELACDLPDALGFPAADTLVGASTRSDRTWVWRVDLTEGKGGKLELPRARRGVFVRWNRYETLGMLPVSADGQVFAVPRSFTAWDIFDRAHFGGGAVYILQVKPLRLLGVVRPKKGCGPVAVAVDHRGGQTTVLSHQCGGGWKFITVPRASAK